MKAYLVTFTATTRVVVEDDANPNEEGNGELFNAITDAAFDNIKKNGFDVYLSAENAEIAPDEECPAGTFSWDKDKAI